jgi:hypothetical protein
VMVDVPDILDDDPLIGVTLPGGQVVQMRQSELDALKGK